jgi:hypothetical protein
VVLLEHVWQLEEAQHVLERVAVLDDELTKRLNRLVPYLEALSSGDVVIEPDASIAVVLECAAVVGRAVGGRLRVRELEALPCQGVTLSAAQIAGKYELVRNGGGSAGLPPATTAEVRWLKRTGVQQLELVTVASPEHAGLNGLQFGLKVLNAGLQTVVVPVVLLASPPPGAAQTAAAALGDSKIRSNGWFSRVHGALQQALRRLINEGLSRPGL